MKSLAEQFKKQPRRLYFSLFISFFWVLFLWNFWDDGVYALGINAFIFFLLMLIFLDTIIIEQKLFSKNNLSWLPAIFLIISSYAIYNNPFIKFFNMLFLPILVTVFINYSFLKNHQKKFWDMSLLFSLVTRIFSPLTRLSRSAKAHKQLFYLPDKSSNILRKIITGFLILFFLAMFVIIPLLSSADPVFKDKLGYIYTWVADILSLQLSIKILFLFIFSIFLYSIFIAWQKPLNVKDKDSETKNIDSISSGIVVGGILLLYLLFLWLQLERLWINGLPTEFKEVEILVKSGFWQLIVLSVINIAIVYFIYKKTSRLVQWILMLFTLVSVLLLFSAAYRMYLYVIFHGLSYEKFFASYTVLYCGILFLYLIIKMLLRSKLNIIKFVAFLFLWMYGFINIMPVEDIILQSNIRLAKNKNSHVNLNESMILSSDILCYVEKNANKDFMKVNNDNDEEVNWQEWLQENRQKVSKKEWYELNLKNIAYLITK